MLPFAPLTAQALSSLDSQPRRIAACNAGPNVPIAPCEPTYPQGHAEPPAHAVGDSHTTWLFLNGGVIDLGIVRTPDLNATNDCELFVETFEAVARRGLESMVLGLELCPNGSTSAPADTDPCSNGS